MTVVHVKHDLTRDQVVAAVSHMVNVLDYNVPTSERQLKKLLRGSACEYGDYEKVVSRHWKEVRG